MNAGGKLPWKELTVGATKWLSAKMAARKMAAPNKWPLLPNGRCTKLPLHKMATPAKLPERIGGVESPAEADKGFLDQTRSGTNLGGGREQSPPTLP